MASRKSDYNLRFNLMNGLRWHDDQVIIRRIAGNDALFLRVSQMDLDDWPTVERALIQAEAMRASAAASAAIDAVLKQNLR